MSKSNKPKHTPGPWVVDGLNARIVHENGVVCDLHYPFDSNTTTDEIATNARLIAASPEMLSALELVLNNNCVMNALDVETRRAIMDAVSKARGES